MNRPNHLCNYYADPNRQMLNTRPFKKLKKLWLKNKTKYIKRLCNFVIL